MTDLASGNGIVRPNFPEKALNGSAIFWFVVAVIGQWAFVYYLVVHYIRKASQGNAAAWADTSVIGYAAGDVVGNIAFGMHVVLAATITFGGTLQLVPQIRKRAIAFHRWNGRLFIITAFIMSLGGVYLTHVRGATTTAAQGITLNALLIMIFAVLTWRCALSQDIQAHRRWALRTFLLVNGVWFFRVFIMGWIIVNQGPVGVGENFDGPAVVIISFACYLVPLAVLEGYFFAKESTSKVRKTIMASTLVVLTCMMAIGIFAAFMFMWKPHF